MFDADSLLPQRVRPLSREDYERLVSLGSFVNERIELLRGTLVTMSPQGAIHSGMVAWLAKELTIALGHEWDVRAHSPYAANDDSEPEPDILVSAGPTSPLLPHPSNPVLLVEVSDSSIRLDRRIKAPLYAETNVPEYWIVDVSGPELRIEVHTEPTAAGYQRVEILRDGNVLRPTRLPGIEIAVRDIPWKR